jgi:hypothetical protein
LHNSCGAVPTRPLHDIKAAAARSIYIEPGGELYREVGKDQVALGREMFWLHYTGDVPG